MRTQVLLQENPVKEKDGASVGEIQSEEREVNWETDPDPEQHKHVR